MANTESQTTLDSADWFLLIRRAFGIPDVVLDSHARATIVGRIASEFEGSDITNEGALSLAEKLLKGVLDLGQQGHLDDCLVTDPGMVKDIREQLGNQEPAHRVMSQVGVAGNTLTQQRAAEAVEKTQRRLSEFVAKNPFADRSVGTRARPFALAPGALDMNG